MQIDRQRPGSGTSNGASQHWKRKDSFDGFFLFQNRRANEIQTFPLKETESTTSANLLHSLPPGTTNRGVGNTTACSLGIFSGLSAPNQRYPGPPYLGEPDTVGVMPPFSSMLQLLCNPFNPFHSGDLIKQELWSILIPDAGDACGWRCSRRSRAR